MRFITEEQSLNIRYRANIFYLEPTADCRYSCRYLGFSPVAIWQMTESIHMIWSRTMPKNLSLSVSVVICTRHSSQYVSSSFQHCITSCSRHAMASAFSPAYTVLSCAALSCSWRTWRAGGQGGREGKDKNRVGRICWVRSRASKQLHWWCEKKLVWFATFSEKNTFLCFTDKFDDAENVNKCNDWDSENNLKILKMFYIWIKKKKKPKPMNCKKKEETLVIGSPSRRMAKHWCECTCVTSSCMSCSKLCSSLCRVLVLAVLPCRARTSGSLRCLSSIWAKTWKKEQEDVRKYDVCEKCVFFFLLHSVRCLFLLEN